LLQTNTKTFLIIDSHTIHGPKTIENKFYRSSHKHYVINVLEMCNLNRNKILNKSCKVKWFQTRMLTLSNGEVPFWELYISFPARLLCPLPPAAPPSWVRMGESTRSPCIIPLVVGLELGLP
jgi:hypothetical protein